MENSTLAISKKIRGMVKASSSGSMEENILVAGFVESKVERVSTKITLEQFAEESGLMARDKNGLKTDPWLLRLFRNFNTHNLLDSNL